MSAINPSTLNDMLVQSSAIVVMGTGGVGKTTTAATLGLRAAKLGRKVIVLTVDPSQRLLEVLGVDRHVSRPQLVHQAEGELVAEVINSKGIFDDFIRRYSKDPKLVEKILNNRLYQTLSSQLTGSQEFTSIQKLFDIHEKNEYDLIILDTPPAENALDFLQSPRKIEALFNEHMVQWFTQAKSQWLVGALGMGSKLIFKTLKILTGSEFVSELEDFLMSVRSWSRQVAANSQRVREMLANKQTQFVLVTQADFVKIQQTQALGEQLVKEGFHLNHLIVNRACPEFVIDIKDADLSSIAIETSLLQDQLWLYTQKMIQFFRQQLQNLENSSLTSNRRLQVVNIPELSDNISSMQDLKAMEVYL